MKLTCQTFTDFSASTLLPKIHARGQGFYSCIDDEALLERIEAYVESVDGRYSDIVLLGIGGSALGPQTLRDSLSPVCGDREPFLHIVDNIDPDLLRGIDCTIDLNRTLFLVITKSGGTPETLSLMSYYQDKITKSGLKIADHFVYITDPKNGFLREQATNQKVPTFPIPENVGGRFSVLTAVGLVPAALIGLDIRALIKGAKAGRDTFLSEDEKTNTAFQMAAWQHHHAETGKTNVVMMPYVQKLKTFCAWYTQLLAESTGKINANGNHVGLTPLQALGVTDQHSQLQLYAQGPNDKQYIFLARKNSGPKVIIPHLPEDPKTTFLQGVDFQMLLENEYKATRATLEELERPTSELSIEILDAETLGMLFLLFEGATAFLGEMMDIDAFNQPGVERSKVLTREYLAKAQ